jgi:addiction module HigA family antidote
MSTVTTVAPVHPPLHPGRILADELAEIDLSQSELARALGIPRSRIRDIIRGVRPIDVESGLRLSRYFGMSDGFWINLQADFDMQVALDRFADELARVQPHHRS